ncbi:MAG: MBL fold metallo-hydrolase [Acidobacteria bacterium]|nr:MBL fold metallo-hydrolase [Acidobacteriota bacterium]MBV9927845.1 MBL fold metallo-hydrolase [Acidobacteriota bacterium]
MRLTVLGSGTSVPHPRRSASAHWVEAEGGTLLLDFSAPAVHRIAEEGLDWADLDAVWVSHFHLDHVGGLAPFLFGTKHAPQTRGRRRPFNVYGPRGTRKLLQSFDEAGGYKLFEQPFPFEVREVSPRAEFEILPGLRAKTLSTPHTSESLALRLEDAGGTSLVYTSDTGYTEALAGFARAADLFLLECSFFREKPVKLHLELSEAMRLAGLSGARRVVLSHLYPEWDDVDLAAEAKRLWDGETLEARDGLRVNIGE